MLTCIRLYYASVRYVRCLSCILLHPHHDKSAPSLPVVSLPRVFALLEEKIHGHTVFSCYVFSGNICMIASFLSLEAFFQAR